MRNLVALFVFCTVNAINTCADSCAVECHAPACIKSCLEKCHSKANEVSDPYFELKHIQTFPRGTIITGSDAPSKPRGRVVFFTTLDGKLYRYNANTEHMKLVHKMTPHELDLRQDKGLYDIALHRDFHRNGRLYLHYSSLPKDNVKENLRDHDNVIAEYEFSGMGLDFVREIKRIPQYTPGRSGGWTKMGLRDGFFSGKVWLYMAVGGNREEIASRNAGEPALSSIYTIAQPEDRTSVEERVWASGIQNPIDCDASVFKLDRIQCLIEDSQGRRHVQSLRKGYNYGSDEFVESCRGLSCKQQYSALASRNAIVTFQPVECPVRSIQMYTGHNMRDYQMDMFLTRDACYDSVSGEFRPSELLRIYRDHSAAQYRTVVMPMNMADDLMINTTLVGADKLDDFYMAGYGLRSGEMHLYLIVPVKAAS
jgi:hypothetical protein